jgi:hypothetical protein
MGMGFAVTVLTIVLVVGTASGQTLRLQPRSSGAPSGSAFAALITSLPRDTREAEIHSQLVQGNVPSHIRDLAPVTVTRTIGGSSHSLTFHVLPDYVAIGTDEDFLLMPMTPRLAQSIADTTGCILPTRAMVDHIYRSATIRLRPQPIAPSAAMITVPVFVEHNDSIRDQRRVSHSDATPGALVAGHKKDIIISNAIYSHLKPGVPRPVVIYGWHRDGIPIQPLYNGHVDTYADYSHGVRLVQRTASLDGVAVDLEEVLGDPILYVLLSDEGPIRRPRYGPLR